MLSIEKLAVGGGSYYVRPVGYGEEDYYRRGGEVAGRWTGRAAGLLGLVGVVDAEEFRLVLDGVAPASGERLRRANGRVNGWDFTFSAPKSVSLLWALGGPEIAEQVVAAHEHAVSEVLGYLEREAVCSRRGKDGVEVLDGQGLVAAGFRHRTSRAGDPQLHTHVVIANTTRCPEDGAWRALHARHLYAHGQAAGYLYQAVLRDELARRLGVEWGPVKRGCAELAAAPVALLREFSQRRRQIEDAAHETGDDSVKARRRLAVATRPAKASEIDEEAFLAEWRARAAHHGVDREGVVGWCDAARASADRSAIALERSGDETLGSVLTEHTSTFDRRDVLVRLAQSATGGATIVQLEETADRFLAHPEVIPVGVALAGVRYTDAGLLAIEADLLASAEGRRHAWVGVCHDPGLVLDRYPHLEADQRGMVEAITTDGAGVSVVVGAAGTGKTSALAAAADVWQTDGYQVLGCALAARAASQLQTATGIPSSSLDLLLTALDRPDTRGLGPRSVVVVDEAAMVGTRKLARLIHRAGSAHAKVVLVGDHHQLPEIQAGGAFAALARRLGGVTLDTNRRQRDPIERQAARALRIGDGVRALELLAGHGHVHHHAGTAATHDRIVVDWARSRGAGRDVIMLAQTRAEVTDLNRRARTLLRSEGELAGPSLTVARRDYAVGDQVMTLRNDYRHGLLNGQRGHVVDIDHDARTLTVAFDDHDTPTRIPAGYLDAGNLDHAYAMTIHKAQGITCDVALVAGGERLYREATYTALTRGRDENHLYVAQEPADHAHDWHQPDDPNDEVRRSLEHSRRQSLALDLLTPHTWEPAMSDKAPEPEIDVSIDLPG